MKVPLHQRDKEIKKGVSWLGNGTQVTADQLTTDATKATITLNKFDTLYPKGGTLVSIMLNNTAAFGAFLKQYDLKILDQIRDVILHKKGNEALILEGSEMGEEQNGSTDLASRCLYAIW